MAGAGRIALVVAMLCWAISPGCSLDSLRLPGKKTSPAPDQKKKEIEGDTPPVTASRELYGRILFLLEKSGGERGALTKARSELEAYVGAHPHKKELPEVVLLDALLGTALRLERERNDAARKADREKASLEDQRRRLDKLAAEQASAQERVKALEEENSELKKIVEQLRDLELDMEKKRRQLR
jgi:chromosome segregation ATPase